MSKIIQRLFSLDDLPPHQSAFLWGPRKVGKSYWIAQHLPTATILDFLRTDLFSEYASRPALLRERYQDHKGLIVLDEVQKIPAMLIVGKKEVAEGLVSVRSKKKGDLGTMPVDKFLKEMQEEISQRG